MGLGVLLAVGPLVAFAVSATRGSDDGFDIEFHPVIVVFLVFVVLGTLGVPVAAGAWLVLVGRSVARGGSPTAILRVCGGLAALVVVAGVVGLGGEEKPPMAGCLLVAACLLVPVVLVQAGRSREAAVRLCVLAVLVAGVASALAYRPG